MPKDEVPAKPQSLSNPLLMQRAEVKKQLTLFERHVRLTISQEFTEDDANELEERINNIKPCLSVFNNVQNLIEHQTNIDLDEFEREAFETSYYKQIAKARSLINTFRPSVINQSPTHSDHNNLNSSFRQPTVNVRLPPVDIPHFNGDFTTWKEFHDRFQSLIHSNNSISEAHKLCYLKASLKDDAATLLLSFETTDANYSIAWQLLVERYDNKRRIVRTHVRSLLDIPSMTKESPEGLSTLINSAEKNIRCLENLGQPVDQWDAMLVPILEAKLDFSTNREWEIHLNSDDQSTNYLPTYNQFTNFLNPFIDQLGLLRVGGRLRNSTLSYDSQHPIILPPNHYLTELIVQHEHHRLFHCGAQLLLSTLRQQYWPIHGKIIANRICHKCIICFRHRPLPTKTFMGNLPRDRVTPSFPFHKCGIDYAGPFLTRDRRTRGYKSYKCYLALFICFSTKAVHLELVSDLTTECFLNALRRFISRRGKPQIIYTDNGTTFVGANNQLKELATFLNNHSKTIQHFNSNEGISWEFIPPRSPHFGGLWEAGIKSIKKHLTKIIHNTILTFESFNTLLTQIEATLNSRPLSALSNDPSDQTPLTPAHFLIGRPLTALPEQRVNNTPVNRLTNYQHLQQMHLHFWRRWHREYLHQLQTRSKWTSSSTPIREGDLVVMIDENQPPARWKLARVTELHSGSDAVTRVVTLQTATGLCKRALKKVCVLPSADRVDEF